MGQEIGLSDYPTIKYSGIFDWNELYKMIHSWFEQKRFDFSEPKHKFKLGGPMGYDSEIDFKGTKKVDEYIQYNFTVSIKIWEYTEIEAIKRGRKVKMSKARIQISFKGNITADYQGRWESSNFWKSLRTFYHKYIIRQTLEITHWDHLYYEMMDLATKIKKELNMETGVSAY